MEETLRDVVTRLGNGREILRMRLKLSMGGEVIEGSDGTRLVLRSGGDDWVDWIPGPNQFKQQLIALHGMAANVLQMAAVLRDKTVNDALTEKIEGKVPYYVKSYNDLQDAIASAENSLNKARAAMYVMTGIITEVDGETEEPEE